MAADSAACRILVVSSSLQQVFHFVDRTFLPHQKFYFENCPTSFFFCSGIKNEVSTSPSEIVEPDKTIPWTITNKYYTANVHFEAREVRAWSSFLAEGVPAVIFLWAHGEVYIPANQNDRHHGLIFFWKINNLSRTRTMLNTFQRNWKIMTRKFLSL